MLNRNESMGLKVGCEYKNFVDYVSQFLTLFMLALVLYACTSLVKESVKTSLIKKRSISPGNLFTLL